MTEHVLVDLSAIVILGIGAQWLAWRLRFPSIIFLLLAGFIAGPLTGFLHTEELMGNLLFPFVSLSVAVILFEGGLTLNLKELRGIGKVVFRLISIGVIVTWGIGALAAHYLLGLNWEIALLLGAVLVVTGPTVIGPLLRHIRPKGKVADVLKWEGIVIDPIGAMLALLVFEAIVVSGNQSTTLLILLNLGKTILFGGTVGVVFAYLLWLLLKNRWVPDTLQETVTLSMVVAAYLAGDLLQTEAGLFSTTIMGIVMANQKQVMVKHILEFKENLRVLIISALFIILASRLEMSVLTHISIGSLLFLAVLIVLARPVSVFLSSMGSRLNLREKFFLSFMAPRGIVAASIASVFALRLTESNVPQAEYLVPLTFIVIAGTVFIYGVTSAPIAKWLKVSQSDPQGVLFVGAHHWARKMAKALQAEGFKTAMVDTNKADVDKARAQGLQAFNGSALSEYIMDEIRFEGLGKLLALTSNEEANSMAVLHFNEVFDRENLYQISCDKENEETPPSGTPQHLRGRFLFGGDVDYSTMNTHFFEGATIQTFTLEGQNPLNQFRESHPEAIPLFLITKNKELQVVSPDKKLTPRPGARLIAMV